MTATAVRPFATVQARAFAKINLTLRVLGRRPDGYHELRTVFQSLALHDRLTFQPYSGSFTIECDDRRCPVDERNLVWRAAALMWTASGRSGEPHGVRVFIRKRIPMQAGLGGGSSDAAAAIRALSTLWCPRLHQKALVDAAASLGADVPFFFHGGTVLGVERGDHLFRLQDHPSSWVVLVQPRFGVSTADAYRWFSELLAGKGRTRAGARRTADGPYGEGGNDLQAPVAAHHPSLSSLIKALRRSGASWAAMSGSGSVCFGLFERRAAAAAAARSLSNGRVTVWLTRTQTAAEYASAAAPAANAASRSPRRR